MERNHRFEELPENRLKKTVQAGSGKRPSIRLISELAIPVTSDGYQKLPMHIRDLIFEVVQ